MVCVGFALLCLSSPALAAPGKRLFHSPLAGAAGAIPSDLYQQSLIGLGLLALLLIGYAVWNFRLRGAIKRKSRELAAAQSDLETRSRALHSLLEVGFALSCNQAVEQLMAQVVQQVREGLGFDRVGIYLIDVKARELRSAIGVAEDGAPQDQRHVKFSLDDTASPVVKVARGELEQYMTDEQGAETGAGRFAFVPLRAGGRVLGVLTVDNMTGGRAFGETEVRHLRGFADEIALALYNAELLRKAAEHQALLERSNRESHALVAFSRAANTARTPHEVIRNIASTVRDGFGFDRVGIFLVEGDQVHGVLGTDEQGRDEDIHSRGWEIEPEGPWAPILSGEREFLYSEDYTRDEGVTTPSGKPIRHHVLLPLKTHEQIIGIIAIDNFITGRPIAETDISPLLSFARQAATALENVQLIDALRSSEERLRMLVTSLSETLYSHRVARGRLIPTYYSPQIEHLTGYTAEEATKTPDLWLDWVHPDDRGRITDGLLDLLNGKSIPQEYRIVHKNGEVRWVLDSPALIRDEEGQVTRVNGAILDITERKHLEERLRQAQKMETIGTLAGGVAHEFNNLLAVIRGNVELATMDTDESHPAHYSLTQAEVAIKRAAGLTEQLLTFSRKTDAKRENVSLNSVIEGTLGLIRPLMSKNVTLDVRTDPDISEVRADAGQIQQVLINLCVNAKDAMPEGGRITVRTQNVRVREEDLRRPLEAPPGDYVRLQVRDTGSGMDAATQERIFEPFFTTKPVGRGTGLGLAVAYAIIGDHRGWMDVESAPGEGTVFSVYLPSVDGERIAPAAMAAPAGRVTVLVVDDDPADRESLAGLLERHGYYALTAADSSEALALFWSGGDSIPLVISDANLPDMDAPELIGHLREQNPEAAVLLSYGEAAWDQRAGKSDPRIAGELRKPYEEGKVLTAVQDALSAVRHQMA